MTSDAQPAYNGECAFAISTGKLDVPGSSKHHVVDDGTTYFFKNGAARFLWRVLPGRSAKAATVWAEHNRE